jgi:hypothetical protein
MMIGYRFLLQMAGYITSALVVIALCGCTSHPSQAPGAFYSAGYILADDQSQVTHKFVVRNTTTEPVKILNVVKSCTCTSFELGSRELRPGDTTALSMSVDINKDYLKKSASCILTTDHPKFNRWVYTIQVVSLPPVLLNPRDVDLGSMAPGGLNNPLVQEVTLDFFAKKKTVVTLNNFVVPPELELSLDPDVEVQRIQRDIWRTSYKAMIGLTQGGRRAVPEDARSGIINRTISINGIDANAARRQYSVYWRNPPRIQSHPSYIIFGDLKSLNPLETRRLIVSSASGATFKILGVESNSASVQIDATVDSDEQLSKHALIVKARHRTGIEPSTNERRRYFSGNIQVQTTDQIQPVVNVPWTAYLEIPS